MMVSSPNPRFWKAFEKEGKTTTRFMDIWTLEELEAARSRMFTAITAVQLRENYKVAGGSIRLTLLKPSMNEPYDILAVIEKAVAKCNPEKVLNTKDASDHSQVEVPDVLVHMKVRDTVNCNSTYIDFASRTVAHLLRTKRKAEIGNWMSGVINSKTAGTYFGVLRGRLFEDYAIEKLVNAGKKKRAFDMECLTGPNRGKKQKLTVNKVRMVDIAEEKNDIERLQANDLGVPVNPNFPVIDACMVSPDNDKLLYFQMKHVEDEKHQTLNRGHLDRLREYRNTGGDKTHPWRRNPLTFVKVVPHFHYRKAGAFQYEPATGASIRQFEQWKLSIPMEED